MAAYNKYTNAIEPLFEAIQAQTDTWKIALALSVNASDTSFVPGTTDLATAGGYTAGGNVATLVSSSATAGAYKLILNDPAQWVASGPGFSFRYAILWNTTTNTPIGYWDNGSVITMNGTNGDAFTLTLDAVNGVLQAS